MKTQVVVKQPEMPFREFLVEVEEQSPGATFCLAISE